MTIKVLGKNVKVVSKNLIGSPAMGFFEIEKNKITICSSLKGDVKTHTLLHEVIHAITYRASLHQVIPHDTQELIADLFSTVLVENFDIKCKSDK